MSPGPDSEITPGATPSRPIDPALSLTHTLREAARHGERAVLLCSFQKEESVLIDELLRWTTGMRPHPPVRIATIDTGVLFPETLQTWRAFEERFGVKIEVQDASSRSEPWSGPEHCCSVAKVAALEARWPGAEGWITGIRREQGPTRAQTELIERDENAACGSTTRSPTGPTRTCGGGSTSATCRTTRCTTRATSRSAARRARSPAPGARAAGQAPRRPSAASMS